MADLLSSQALSGLIGSIYDCALDPSRWDQTLADISEALDCFALLLALNDLRHERLLLHKCIGLEPYQFERLSIYLPEVSAMLRGALASRPSLDDPHVMSRHLSPAYIEKSPYFREWQKPAGMVDFMMFFLMHEPMHLATFGVGRNERQGIITEREIERGKLLLPHVRRAVTISNVLDIRTIGVHGWPKPSTRLMPDVFMTDRSDLIVSLAARHRIPAVFGSASDFSVGAGWTLALRAHDDGALRHSESAAPRDDGGGERGRGAAWAR